MSIPVSHHPDTRHYHGEKFAQDAVDFLNDDGLPKPLSPDLLRRLKEEEKRFGRPPVLSKMLKHPKKLSKVEQTETVRTFEQARKRVIAIVELLKSIFGKPCRDEYFPQMRRINRLLGRYKVFKTVFPQFKPGSYSEIVFSFLEHASGFRGITPRECRTVQSVMRLAELGALHRLKTCKHCGVWLFARFTHQQFCSKNCQVKHNAASDQWKEYKRNKAREYYHLHRSGKVRER